jgi:hypothetical protein
MSAKQKQLPIIGPDDRPANLLFVPVKRFGTRFYREWISGEPRVPVRNWIGADIQKRGNPILPDGSLIVAMTSVAALVVDKNGNGNPACIELFESERLRLRLLIENALMTLDGETQTAPMFSCSYSLTLGDGTDGYALNASPSLLEAIWRPPAPPNTLHEILPFGEKLYLAARSLKISLDGGNGLGGK